MEETEDDKGGTLRVCYFYLEVGESMVYVLEGKSEKYFIFNTSSRFFNRNQGGYSLKAKF